MDHQVDSNKSFDRLQGLPAADRKRRRAAGPVLVPTLLVIGFCALTIAVFGDRLRPRVPVETHPALLMANTGVESFPEGESAVRSIAQASGWIEPDPYPVRVPALIDGFIASVEVLEGQAVRAGDLLARFDETNFRLAVTRAEAEWKAARAEAEAAEIEHEQMKAEWLAAEARRKAAQDRARRAQALQDSYLAEAERVAAVLEEEEASAEVEAARLKLESHQRLIDRLRALEERTHAELEQARIDLERTRIVSPIDGIVLRRHVSPGMKRMVASDEPDGSTIMTLYDPKRLQVRADVPLAEAGKLQTGMAARITSAAFPDRVFTGVVTRIVGEADLSRNTLQVKVALFDPDPRMRPEMLCRVEFVATERGARAQVPSASLWIPKVARQTDSQGGSFVWVVDALRGIAEPRTIRLSGEERDGWVRVIEGLRAGEKVVIRGAERLRPGARVAEKRVDSKGGVT